MMSEEQLLQNLINKGESEHLEFMEVVRKESIARNFCAFLNADGGRVIIGVTDNSEVVGVSNAQKHKVELQSFLLNAIVPDVVFTITIESIDEKDLLVIKVGAGSKQPYIFDGNIYYRRDTKTQKASSREISSLIHDRQIAEQHWERKNAFGVEIDDLDEKLILSTIKESRKKHRSTYEGVDILGFLTHYGLYVNGSFTNACVILFAKSPSKFIPQIRVRLTEYSEGKTDDNLLRDKIFEGNLFHIRDSLEKYINGLGVRSVFDKKQWKRIDFTFPKVALQEGIINALMHRDYSSYSSTVAISVYPNRFIISNNGKLPDDIKVRDLKKNHSSHPVNPDIAHVVFLRGLIDKLGKGTIKVLEECKIAGLKVPEWKETSSNVVLTFNGPKALAERIDRSDAVNDAVNDAIKTYVRDAVNDAVNDVVSDAVINRLINEIIKIWSDEGKGLKEFKVARATMQRDMALLKAHQFIVFEGAAKSGVYKLTEEFKNRINNIK